MSTYSIPENEATVQRIDNVRAILRVSAARLDDMRISDRSESYASAAVCPGGVEFKENRFKSSLPPSVERGTINGFSRGSRRRLMGLLMRVPLPCWESGSFFLTLTYPSDYPSDWVQYKRDLTTFRKRLFRKYPDVWACWKLEYQTRGAPHYHILLGHEQFTRDHLGAFVDWCLRSWFEIVGSEDRDHRKHGCYCVPCYSGKKLMNYLSKYLGKVWSFAGATGRVWGVWGDLPQLETGRLEFITERSWIEFLRRLRRWGRKSRYLSTRQRGRGFQCYNLQVIDLTRGLDVCYIEEESPGVESQWLYDRLNVADIPLF